MSNHKRHPFGIAIYATSAAILKMKVAHYPIYSSGELEWDR
jgi:hypothetical protein